MTWDGLRRRFEDAVQPAVDFVAEQAAAVPSPTEAAEALRDVVLEILGDIDVDVDELAALDEEAQAALRALLDAHAALQSAQQGLLAPAQAMAAGALAQPWITAWRPEHAAQAVALQRALADAEGALRAVLDGLAAFVALLPDQAGAMRSALEEADPRLPGWLGL